MKHVRLLVHLAPDHRIGDPDSPPPWEALPGVSQYVNHTTVPPKKSMTNILAVVGRKTWEMTSDEHKQSFPKRRFVVLSRTRYILDGCEVVKSPEEVFDLRKPDETILVLGGKATFDNFLKYANMVCFAKWDGLPKKSILRPPDMPTLEWDMTGAGCLEIAGCATRTYSKNFW